MSIYKKILKAISIGGFATTSAAICVVWVQYYGASFADGLEFKVHAQQWESQSDFSFKKETRTQEGKEVSTSTDPVCFKKITGRNLLYNTVFGAIEDSLKCKTNIQDAWLPEIIVSVDSDFCFGTPYKTGNIRYKLEIDAHWQSLEHSNLLRYQFTKNGRFKLKSVGNALCKDLNRQVGERVARDLQANLSDQIVFYGNQSNRIASKEK